MANTPLSAIKAFCIDCMTNLDWLKNVPLNPVLCGLIEQAITPMPSVQ